MTGCLQIRSFTGNWWVDPNCILFPAKSLLRAPLLLFGLAVEFVDRRKLVFSLQEFIKNRRFFALLAPKWP
jgi:hypothetical protein